MSIFFEIKEKLRNFVVRVSCIHRYDMFVRNIYGDEINLRGFRRSEWSCSKCGSRTFR